VLNVTARACITPSGAASAARPARPARRTGAAPRARVAMPPPRPGGAPRRSVRSTPPTRPSPRSPSSTVCRSRHSPGPRTDGGTGYRSGRWRSRGSRGSCSEMAARPMPTRGTVRYGPPRPERSGSERTAPVPGELLPGPGAKSYTVTAVVGCRRPSTPASRRRCPGSACPPRSGQDGTPAGPGAAASCDSSASSPPTRSARPARGRV
jgi:hypothetical protein